MDPATSEPREHQGSGPYDVELGYRLTVVLEPDGRVRWATEVSGMVTPPKEYFIGRTMEDIVTERAGPERGRLWRDRIERAQTAINAAHYVDPAPGAPPEAPPSVECTVTPIRDVDGSLRAILMDVQDRTREFATRARLAASEERFRELAETLPQIIWETDGDGNVTYFSSRWLEFSGRTPEQLLGRNFLSLIHPDDLPGFAPRPHGRPPGPIQFRMLRRDGEYRWMESHIQVVRDASGAVLRSVGTTLDITDRLAEERTARERHEQLLGALEVSGLGRFAMDLRTQGVRADERVSEILGVAAVAPGGDAGLIHLADVVHPEDRQRVEATFAAAVAHGAGYDVTHRILRPIADGTEERWIRIHGRIESDERGPARLLGVLEDVTDRQREAQARQLMQKRDMLGTLAGGIAHDFNNLLTAIGSNAALAKHELAAGASPATSLDEISQATSRAAELVGRMLAHSREDEPRREPVDLGAVAREACSLLRPTLPKTAVLEQEVDEPLPPVVGDATQLHQVVMNLVANAGQALGPIPGTIAVRVEHHPGRSGDHPPAGAGHVRLSIRDDGPGMSDAVRLRVFDPFFTTKPAGEGTGLGLAAAQSIVRDHGGSIGVESVLGSHTEFWVELPVPPTS